MSRYEKTLPPFLPPALPLALHFSLVPLAQTIPTSLSLPASLQSYRHAMREFRRVLKMKGKLVMVSQARRPVFQVGRGGGREGGRKGERVF